jgi:hypothetical protein
MGNMEDAHAFQKMVMSALDESKHRETKSQFAILHQGDQRNCDSGIEQLGEIS